MLLGELRRVRHRQGGDEVRAHAQANAATCGEWYRSASPGERQARSLELTPPRLAGRSVRENASVGRTEETLLACSRCGAENPAGARFCNGCGAELAAASVQEERKLVSVLFVDLVEFTARSDRADPEDIRDTLELYHSKVKEQIEEYGGVVEKFIGDAVMAVFGAPVSHGDDAERAVRAGFRVLAGIEELNDVHGLGLAARAAVNTGEALVTLGGAVGQPLATGDVVNTASRLQSAAPTGRLIVGEETHRATQHAFRFERRAPVQAKGKAEPVRAWLAIAPAAEPAERPIAATPLVGRDRELELVQSIWERTVTERRPHLITVFGPPGIGKTRFCREVEEIVGADGGRILRGRCLPYEEQTGYQAFAGVVKQLSGILESDIQEVARSKLERAVVELLPAEEAADTARYLALLTGLGREGRAEEVGLLFLSARRLIECVGHPQPTLVVFEDIHWAKPSELELLEYLAKHVQDSSTLMLALARPELLDARAGWGSGLHAQTTIPLEPLSRTDANALAAHLLGANGNRGPDVARLVEIAEGNPLFLEELAASVAEEDTQDLPVTVKAAIAARIDAIPADARAALLGAAVIGKTFWRGPLRAMGCVADLESALDALEERDLIRRDATSQVADDAQFTFKHILIREVAYATLPRAIRRERHAAVARYIEGSVDDPGETLAWILAHHWREAGEPARAIPYLLAAAEAAQRGWAKDAAADFYTRALELAEGDDQRRDIRLRRALALVALEDFQRAADELADLLPELEGRERLEALLARGRATHWSELDLETIETAEQAVALAEEIGDEEALPAALALLSQGLQMRGAEGDLDRAIELGERALREWVPGARRADHGEALYLYHDTMYWTGSYERAAELAVAGRQVAADVRGAELLLRGGGGQGLALAGLGRHEEALRIFDELFAISEELGRNPRVLLNYSALIFRELNDLEEARRRSEEALERSESLTFSMPRSFARSDLIFTDLLAGDVGAAQAAWPQMWSDAEHATAWTRWLIYGRLAAARAEIALDAEPPESALEWAQRTLEITTRTRRRKYEVRAREIYGQALARLGRHEEALSELHRAVEIADALVGPPARWHARATLGRVAYSLGEDDRAAAAYAEGRRLVDEFAATLAPERAAKLATAPVVDELRSPGR
jgi:class 3 adenylate cyclase/tetratricopeptide (TPR) repeat protein